MVRVFDYRGWPRRRLHNPRTARRKERQLGRSEKDEDEAPGQIFGNAKLEIRKTAN